MIDLTPVLNALIGLAVTLITAFLIPYLRSKLSQTQMDRIKMTAEIAVMAAEEAGRSGLIDKSKKYDYVKTYLEKQGFTFNSDELQKLIDATVWELINQFGKKPEVENDT